MGVAVGVVFVAAGVGLNGAKLGLGVSVCTGVGIGVGKIVGGRTGVGIGVNVGGTVGVVVGGAATVVGLGVTVGDGVSFLVLLEGFGVGRLAGFCTTNSWGRKNKLS